MTKTIRDPHIQSLRALAALLVLVYHADLLPGGYIGVDIFYVISGYLITKLLLRELESSAGLRFSAFYARRFQRLLPASFLTVVTTGIVGWILLPSTYRADFGRDLIAASTYLSNFLFALWNNDYQNLGTTPSPFIHFWSLAVEEQFYLFWPLLLLIFFRIHGRRGVQVGVLSIAVLSFLFSLYLTERFPVWSFYILPTRAWEMAAGALLVFISADSSLRRFNSPQWGFIAIIAIALSSLIFNENTAFPGLAAVPPVIATALLIQSRAAWPRILGALSNFRLTQWLGRISYPLYLWHWPVLIIPEIYFARKLNWYEIILAISIILFLSDITNRFVEEPIRYSTKSPALIFKLATFATVISISLGLVISYSYSSSVTASNGFTFDIEEVRMKPKINDDGCHIHYGSTVSPKCEYGDTGSKSSIVLYGDSHAAQWFPALDLIGKKYNIKIISLTKSACPSAEVIKELSSQYKVKDCQDFRDSSIARIEKEDPRAVIMTGMQPFTAPNSKVDSRKWWLAGEAKAYSRIKEKTMFPIYLTDTPLPRFDIPTCLAGEIRKDCDTSRPVSSEVAPGLIKIDPTPWLCKQSCAAQIEGIVVYRDHSHLSVAMSEYLADALAKELIRIGVIE